MTPDTQALKEAAENYVALVAKADEIHPRVDGNLNLRIHLAFRKFEDAATAKHILALIADNDRLQKSLKTIVDFHNLPASAKRPDVWQRVLSKAAKAIKGE